MSTVAGKLVAVTGGARGIGLAIAAALVERGARVALGEVDVEEAQQAAQRLGPGALAFEADVTSIASFGAFIGGAEEQFGQPLDVLVNNAGIMWVGRFDEEPEAAEQRQMDVNFHGVVRGMKLAIPEMRARGRGHVVNVASAASKLPTAGEATYSATKHAVYGYSVAVREELRGSGIQVSVIMPVVVDTELATGTSTGKGVRLQPSDVADAVVSAIEKPRFDVFVPRSIAAWTRLTAVLPQPGRDALYRAMMPNQAEDADAGSRVAYEDRNVLRHP